MNAKNAAEAVCLGCVLGWLLALATLYVGLCRGWFDCGIGNS